MARMFKEAQLSYYEHLELPRTATYEEIYRNFHQLSQKWHPMNNPTDMLTSQTKFNELCEAFDVLSNRKFH